MSLLQQLQSLYYRWLICGQFGCRNNYHALPAAGIAGRARIRMQRIPHNHSKETFQTLKRPHCSTCYALSFTSDGNVPSAIHKSCTYDATSLSTKSGSKAVVTLAKANNAGLFFSKVFPNTKPRQSPGLVAVRGDLVALKGSHNRGIQLRVLRQGSFGERTLGATEAYGTQSQERSAPWSCNTELKSTLPRGPEREDDVR